MSVKALLVLACSFCAAIASESSETMDTATAPAQLRGSSSRSMIIAQPSALQGDVQIATATSKLVSGGVAWVRSLMPANVFTQLAQKQTPDSATDDWTKNIPQKTLSERFMDSCVYVIMVCIVAYVYVQFGGRDRAPEITEVKGDQDPEHFHFSLCECNDCCGRDLKMCLCAMCCTGIRWADTVSQEKMKLDITFWVALAIFTTCYVLNDLIVPHGVVAPVLIAILVFYRQKLRAAFGLPHGTCGTCCCDCLSWTFCSCCTAIQEARQVHYVEARSNQ